MYTDLGYQEDERDNPFADLVGKEVKVPYRDGDQVKVAYGKLVQAQGGFVKIVGRLGAIILNERNIISLAQVQ